MDNDEYVKYNSDKLHKKKPKEIKLEKIGRYNVWLSKAQAVLPLM